MPVLRQLSELPTLRLQGKKPKYQQIYQQIKHAITTRQLTENMLLPPSRALAKDLGISRNTVQKAYEQLIAEGYLHSKIGSGIFVCVQIPDNYTAVKTETGLQNLPLTRQKKGLTFTPGILDLDHFPTVLWQSIVHSVLRTEYKHHLYSIDELGDATLPQAITEYLTYTRGISCTAEQVLITAGAQEAINLCLQTLLNENDSIAIENPGYRGVYNVAEYKRCKIIPIPVSHDGFDVGALQRKKTIPKLIYVTPSHQYPLCMTLPISKRLQLLDYAQQHKSYIIEDDYDSEFHYQTDPTPAMQDLGYPERVIYMGTFSKILFPALRLGFLILPNHLVKKFSTIKTLQFGRTTLLNQMVTAEFIKQGHFTKHIKKMRLHYAKKYQQLINSCEKYLPSEIKRYTHSVGLHISLQFPKNYSSNNEKQFIKLLNENHLFPVALSTYYYKDMQMGIVLGFGMISCEKIDISIKKLAKLYRQRMLE